MTEHDWNPYSGHRQPETYTEITDFVIYVLSLIAIMLFMYVGGN